MARVHGNMLYAVLVAAVKKQLIIKNIGGKLFVAKYPDRRKENRPLMQQYVSI
jgi:hypothetical protein